ncbi:class I tRNA ligase family protein, partial [Candidatus Parcubacteria bacterium]|nr:class I tRNA ligase family protein [Candidatus Parcubacteria bacterium]
KKLKNYPDPMGVVEKYGADALRYYLLSSSVIRGEDLRFNEKGVDEVSKKLLMRLDNVRSFYELYADGTKRSNTSNNALDRWILVRLNSLIQVTTEGYEGYKLDSATGPLMDFVDDLSNWYVRRSRDRFKEKDHTDALQTLRYVLYTATHIMAPVMPFFAEDLYQKIKEDGDPESIHLSAWPEAGEEDRQLLIDMAHMRSFASKGLELRERAGIKIRQPLASLTIPTFPANRELSDLVAAEVNVKEIKEGSEVTLDTNLTDELREEGTVRNLIRQIQEWRKEQNFTIADRPTYTFVGTDEEREIAKKYKQEIITATNLNQLDI